MPRVREHRCDCGRREADPALVVDLVVVVVDMQSPLGQDGCLLGRESGFVVLVGTKAAMGVRTDAVAHSHLGQVVRGRLAVHPRARQKARKPPLTIKRAGCSRRDLTPVHPPDSWGQPLATAGAEIVAGGCTVHDRWWEEEGHGGAAHVAVGECRGVRCGTPSPLLSGGRDERPLSTRTRPRPRSGSMAPRDGGAGHGE